MTEDFAYEHLQFQELLPNYLTGRLQPDSAELVRTHLLSCEVCQQDLQAWKSVQEASREFALAAPLPSLQLMQSVWERIDSSAHQEQQVRAWSFFRPLGRFWTVLWAQMPLLHKSIWIGSALTCMLGLILTLGARPVSSVQIHFMASLLVLFLVIAGASGSAFIYGSTSDPGFELALSTPTSVRLLVICRLMLVLGYNLMLACAASAIFALVYGGSLWGFIQLWLGPMLFLFSLGLAISLCLSSMFALLFTTIIEVWQHLPEQPFLHWLSFAPISLDLGSTNPPLLLAALLLLIFALLFAPRQRRLIALV